MNKAAAVLSILSSLAITGLGLLIPIAALVEALGSKKDVAIWCIIIIALESAAMIGAIALAVRSFKYGGARVPTLIGSLLLPGVAMSGGYGMFLTAGFAIIVLIILLAVDTRAMKKRAAEAAASGEKAPPK